MTDQPRAADLMQCAPFYPDGKCLVVQSIRCLAVAGHLPETAVLRTERLREEVGPISRYKKQRRKDLAGSGWNSPLVTLPTCATGQTT